MVRYSNTGIVCMASVIAIPIPPVAMRVFIVWNVMNQFTKYHYGHW